MSTIEMQTFTLDGTGPAGQHATTDNERSGRQQVKVWLKKRNAAMQYLKSATALLDGRFPGIPIPENGAAIVKKLSKDLAMAEAGLKECRRIRQLALAKNKRDAAKANAHRFRAATIAATFAAVGASEDDGAGEGPPSPKKRKVESESESEEGDGAGEV